MFSNAYICKDAVYAVTALLDALVKFSAARTYYHVIL